MRSPIESRLSGPGLHDGLPARLTLSLRPESGQPDSRGLRFLLPGAGELTLKDLGGMAREAPRSTVLRRPGAEPPGAAAQGIPASAPALLKTPEHLLASLLFFSGLPLDIACDAAELPGLDGSALPYREALSRLAPERGVRPSWIEYPSNLAWEYPWSYGWMRVRPAARFRVRFELDRPPLRQVFVLEDAATAWSEILPARTFAFHREWLQASSQGLMAGAGADSGLLLAETGEEHASLLRAHPAWRGGPFPLLNQPAWRMENEPVKHKILDLLGDLALIGSGGPKGMGYPAGPALPALDIEIRNGGHWTNHLLIDQIQAARNPRSGENSKGKMKSEK